MLANATHNVNLWGCIFFRCSFTASIVFQSFSLSGLGSQ
jgi:hypothetical protein